MKKTMKQATTSMKAIGYARVSTLEQVNEGVSLDAQVARIQAYATLRGLDLVEVVREEGVSGGTPFASRPASSQVLARLAAGDVGAIVVCKLDRAFRDAGDALNVTAAWDRAGVALHVLDMGGNSLDTASAMGRMFLTMAAGFAELERNLIGERTAAALAHLRGAGVRLGGEGLGWQRAEETDAEGRKLVQEVPEEVETLQRIHELRAAGLPLRGIAERLTSEGRRTKRGGRWAAETVRLILERSA